MSKISYSEAWTQAWTQFPLKFTLNLSGNWRGEKKLSHLLVRAQLPSVFDNVLRESEASFSSSKLIVTLTVCTVGSCCAKAATLLNSRRAVSPEPVSQRVLDDMPGVCLPSCVFCQGNVLSWDIFIITKLIRGCRRLIRHIWMGRNVTATSGTQTAGRFSYPRTNTQTHRRLLVFI